MTLKTCRRCSSASSCCQRPTVGAACRSVDGRQNRCRGHGCRTLEMRNQRIGVAADTGDVTRMARFVAEQFAQHAHGLAQLVLRTSATRPDLIAQCPVVHRLAVPDRQGDEQRDLLTGEVDGPVIRGRAGFPGLDQPVPHPKPVVKAFGIHCPAPPSPPCVVARRSRRLAQAWFAASSALSRSPTRSSTSSRPTDNRTVLGPMSAHRCCSAVNPLDFCRSGGTTSDSVEPRLAVIENNCSRLGRSGHPQSRRPQRRS